MKVDFTEFCRALKRERYLVSTTESSKDTRMSPPTRQQIDILISLEEEEEEERIRWMTNDE